MPGSNEVKFVGVTNVNKLKFDSHIVNICFKVYQKHFINIEFSLKHILNLNLSFALRFG